MTTCPVTEFFQWAADCGRIRVAHTPTTQQITMRLPDYDSPEDPEEDYEVVFPPTDFSFEVPPADDHGRVTIQLLLTDEIVAEIPRVHFLFHRQRVWSAKVFPVSILRNQITTTASVAAIRFYADDDADGYLSNYYGRQNARNFVLRINGVNWASVEHYFQAAKFASAADEASIAYVQHIANAKTPNIARILALQKKGGGFKWRTALNEPIAASLAAGVRPRPDWDVYRNTVMEQAVTAKFEQNPALRALLLATGDAPLVEASPRDSYWGAGPDGKGQNQLGQILQRVRATLQQEK